MEISFIEIKPVNITNADSNRIRMSAKRQYLTTVPSKASQFLEPMLSLSKVPLQTHKMTFQRLNNSCPDTQVHTPTDVSRRKRQSYLVLFRCTCPDCCIIPRTCSKHAGWEGRSNRFHRNRVKRKFKSERGGQQYPPPIKHDSPQI